ncbi:MAG: chaperone modulatory protein CbpM [Enterobacterales bacterium]|jgi:chaperone modulatory protein CbpM
MTEVILHGVLLDEEAEFSFDELCSVCSISTEWVIALVEVGALDPVNYQQISIEQQTQWIFSAKCMKRAHTARKLQRDLGVNQAGVALVLDLLEEIEALESKLQQLNNPTA